MLATDTPIYGNKWLMGAGGWVCKDWMDWYYALKNVYGKDPSRSKWIDAWNVGALSTITTVPLDCRTFDSDFKKFLIDESLYDVVNNPLSKLLSTSTTLVDTVENAAQSTADTANFFAKNMKLIITVAIIVVVAVVVIVVLRKK
jgi:hypothetical protein